MQQRTVFTYGSEARKLNSETNNRSQNPGVQSWAATQARRERRNSTASASEQSVRSNSTVAANAQSVRRSASAAGMQSAGKNASVAVTQSHHNGRSASEVTRTQSVRRNSSAVASAQSVRRSTSAVAPIQSVEPKAVHREHISPQFLVFLTLFIFAMGFSITMYIRLSSDIIGYREQCANLQSQYESLKTSNDLYEQRINNSVDLNEIEKIAVCDLGMKLAGEGQIVVYSGEIEDYVKQYSDLPE